jgi:signal peptidase II
VTPVKKQICLIVMVFLVVLIIDQTTKYIIRSKYPVENVLMIGAKQFFRISHQENPGVVGGIFRDNRVMAYASPLAATLVLLYLYFHLNSASKIQSIAYGLIWAGALGNLIDRIRLGVVTDFLQFHFYFGPFDFPWKVYPAFNVADMGICTGVFLLIVSWYWIGAKSVPDAA